MHRLFVGLLAFLLCGFCHGEDAVVVRASWSTVQPDAAVLAKQPMGAVRHVSIHHTETPVPDSVSEEQRLRNIQNYHQATQGWGDIAYHYLIGPSGKVYEGRSERYAASSGTIYLTKEQWEAGGQDASGRTLAGKPPGGVKPGHSEGHLTVCFIGSYGKSLPTEAARRAAVALVARKLAEHHLGADDIYFHREIAWATDCPGQTLYEWFRGSAPRRGTRGAGLDAIAAVLSKTDGRR